jgi:hypothetical protein
LKFFHDEGDHFWRLLTPLWIAEGGDTGFSVAVDDILVDLIEETSDGEIGNVWCVGDGTKNPLTNESTDESNKAICIEENLIISVFD